MTRPRVILGPSGAYHVIAETREGVSILACDWAADLLAATLAYFRQALSFRLYACTILMQSFEAVIAPAADAESRGAARPATISKIMMEIKGSFAHWYNLKLGRRGSVWEKRFRDRLLLTPEEIHAAVREVNMRPVAMGLAERPEEYPHSGISTSRRQVPLIDLLPVAGGPVPVEVSALARRAG